MVIALSRVLMINPHFEQNGLSNGEPEIELIGGSQTTVSLQMIGGYFSSSPELQGFRRVFFATHNVKFSAYGTRWRTSDIIDCNNQLSATTVILVGLPAPPLVYNYEGGHYVSIDPSGYASLDQLFNLKGLSATPVRSNNLRGSFVVEGSISSLFVDFNVAEPDDAYFLVATPTLTTGAPYIGRNRIQQINKYADGFEVTLESAPGR